MEVRLFSLVARKALLAGFVGLLWSGLSLAEEYFDKYGPVSYTHLTLPTSDLV